jgi:hypothetical protein
LAAARRSSPRHSTHTRARAYPPPPFFKQRKPLPPHVRDRTILDRQAEWSRAKAERLRVLQVAVAEEERRECTFRPAITEAARAHAGGLPAEVRAALLSPGGGGGGGGVDEEAVASRRAFDEAAFIKRMALAKSKREEDAARREALGRVAGAAGEGGSAAAAPQFATAARAAAREGVTLRAADAAAAGALSVPAAKATPQLSPALPRAAPRPAGADDSGGDAVRARLGFTISPAARANSPTRGNSPPIRRSPPRAPPPPQLQQQPVHPGRSLYTSPLPPPAAAGPIAQPSPAVWVVRASGGAVVTKA